MTVGRRRLLALILPAAISLLAACGSEPRSQTSGEGAKPMATMRVQTLFYWCNDPAAMRDFFSEVVGLKETYFDDGPGWLTYDVGGLQIVFMRGSKPVAVESGWARQPGWNEGTLESASLVIQLAPADFDAAVARARAKGADVFKPEPVVAKGQRQFFLRDPMGRTVELYDGP
jgi:catechol 2,3-dioxygenase-like lactoylglutathione lyase family enzyme